MPARGVRDAQRENGGLWRISACRAGGEQRGATGEGQNGSLTTIAAITQVFPNATFFPPWADPS
jgi:hypothetical protein